MEGFRPVRVMEVELSQPLPALAARHPGGGPDYGMAVVLARLHTQPIGLAEIPLTEAGLSPGAVAAALWQALGEEINQHLRQDGLAEAAGLEASGLPGSAAPACLRAREAALRTAPLISVVVATRERTERLALTLRSLLAQSYPRYEIIVVDNAPRTTATAEFMRSTYGHSSLVRYVREDQPGLGAAHNTALPHVRGEIVAITDDDVEVDRHWLAEIARGFAAAPNVGCVTGMIVPAELETPAQWWLEQFAGFSKGFSLKAFNLTDHRPADPLFPWTAGRFGSGASMAFSTAALRSMGGFDPAMGTGTPAMGADDLSAFFDFIVRGYTLVYQPAAIVYHSHRREYAALRRQAYGYGVGLGAFLTRTMLTHPSKLAVMLARAPRALIYILDPRSAKNRKKQADYPRELTWLERLGMLSGPWALLRSRGRARRWQAEAARGQPRVFSVPAARQMLLDPGSDQASAD